MYACLKLAHTPAGAAHETPAASFVAFGQDWLTCMAVLGSQGPIHGHRPASAQLSRVSVSLSWSDFRAVGHCHTCQQPGLQGTSLAADVRSLVPLHAAFLQASLAQAAGSLHPCLACQCACTTARFMCIAGMCLPCPSGIRHAAVCRWEAAQQLDRNLLIGLYHAASDSSKV